MRELVGRGVHIRVLTNSLASTDSPLVHNGYARYRVALLKLGVELSRGAAEARAEAAALSSISQLQRQPACQGAGHRSEDGVHRFLNMDARSAHTNSELGLVMRSPRSPAR
jgi:putative cardiolipin synthase